MDAVTKVLSKAIVCETFYNKKYDQSIYIKLGWEEQGKSKTYKYLLNEFLLGGEPRLYFAHESDKDRERCPLCLTDDHHDCIDLTKEQYEILKDKLIQFDLKLLFALS